MSKIKEHEHIKDFIIENIPKHPKDIAKYTADKYKVSRQAVNKHLQILVKDKIISVEGNTKARIYSVSSDLLEMVEKVTFIKQYDLNQSLEEDKVWQEDIAKYFENVNSNVRGIWQYGFTEMFNNIIDHSNAKQISILIMQNANDTKISLYDDGIGIFKKIQKALNLVDERQSLIELAKGKFTTDPNNHTGEGIFFTSKAFDYFNIVSGDVSFYHNIIHSHDFIFDNQKNFKKGTAVSMSLNNNSKRVLKEVFDEYSVKDNYEFDKTIVPLILAQYDKDNLISRSQAKRILARIDRFKIVVFDFTDIEIIGQGFADEIFRVFFNQHPEIEFSVMNANQDVKNMIKRVNSSFIL